MPGGGVQEGQDTRGDTVQVECVGGAVRLGEQPVGGEPLQSQRAEQGAVLAHGRRGTHSVSHDVPDHEQGAPARQGDGVVPVPADLGAASGGEIAAGDLHTRARYVRGGQEGALHLQRGLVLVGVAQGVADARRGPRGQLLQQLDVVLGELGESALRPTMTAPTGSPCGHEGQIGHGVQLQGPVALQAAGVWGRGGARCRRRAG